MFYRRYWTLRTMAAIILLLLLSSVEEYNNHNLHYKVGAFLPSPATSTIITRRRGGGGGGDHCTIHSSRNSNNNNSHNHHYQQHHYSWRQPPYSTSRSTSQIASSTKNQEDYCDDNDNNTNAQSLGDGDDDDGWFDESFTSLLGGCLSPEILASIPHAVPTPIQALALPKILQQQKQQQEEEEKKGSSSSTSQNTICVEAPTGSGKTMVYAVSLLQKLLYSRPPIFANSIRNQQTKTTDNNKNKNGAPNDDDNNISTNNAVIVRSLILCPTRELCIQIGKVVEILAETSCRNLQKGGRRRRRPLEVLVLHGGTPVRPQRARLLERAANAAATATTKEGSQNTNNDVIDIVVATPGRLVDLLSVQEDSRDVVLQDKLSRALDKHAKGGSLSLNQLQELELVDLESSLSSSEDDDDDVGSGNGGSYLLQNMLSNLEYLVMDEADRLLSRAFEKEVEGVLDLIIGGGGGGGGGNNNNSNSNSDAHDINTGGRQQLSTWLFSATFPMAMEPRVDAVLSRLGSDQTTPVWISCVNSDRRTLSSSKDNKDEVSTSLQKRLDRTKLHTTSGSNYKVQHIGPASTIRLRTVRLEKRDRTQALRRLLDDNDPEWDRVLVFVATRYTSEHVARKLRRVGFAAAELHGKLDQDARLRRLKAFEAGRTRVLLATDVASRGLDIDGLPVVVNYDLPRSTADFVHRVGRTGRAGRPGTAVTFCTPTSEAQLDLIERRHLPKPVEREVLPGFEPNEEEWEVQSRASRLSVPGVKHSQKGLAHDRMHGGIKGRRKSKKDKLREKAAREAAAVTEEENRT